MPAPVHFPPPANKPYPPAVFCLYTERLSVYGFSTQSAGINQNLRSFFHRSAGYTSLSDYFSADPHTAQKKYTSSRKIAADYGQAIFELMNEAYSPLYGYSPLSQRQIDQYVKMYLPILDLRMVTLITDADDKLVCVGISMPSLAEALQNSHGRLLPLGWFYLLKALFMKRRAKMLDLLLVAVIPEYQNKGVNALLFSDLIPVYQKLGFIFAESNPELEMNGKVQAQWEYFKTEQLKRRRAFTKKID